MKKVTAFATLLFFFMAPVINAQSSELTVPFTEIQWSICEPSTEAVQRKLAFELPAPENRSVYFLETKNMDLAQRSATVRVRVSSTGKIKSSAKVNYPDAQQLPWDLLDGKSSKCEWDTHGPNKKVGCSLEHKTTQLKKALSDAQSEYLEQATGFSGFSDLLTLGPVTSQTWTWSEKDLGVNLDLETVSGPGSLFQIELSTRAPTKEAVLVTEKFEKWIRARSLTLCPQQQGLTKTLIPALLKEHGY